jgi:hypothetical protein
MDHTTPESEEARLARLRLEVKRRVARAHGDDISDAPAAAEERLAWASPRRVLETLAERSARLDSEVKRRVLREINSPTAGGRLLKYATPKKLGPEEPMLGTIDDPNTYLSWVSRLNEEHASLDAETRTLNDPAGDASSFSPSAGEDTSIPAEAPRARNDSDSTLLAVVVKVAPLVSSTPEAAPEAPVATSATEDEAPAVEADAPAPPPSPERQWAYGSELDDAVLEQFTASSSDHEALAPFGSVTEGVDLQAIFSRQSISYTKRYSTGDWSQVRQKELRRCGDVALYLRLVSFLVCVSVPGWSFGAGGSLREARRHHGRHLYRPVSPLAG